MPDYSNENSEHYDGDYNGKPIVYEEGLHDLFRQKADLTEADRKLLADSELPTDLVGAKAALDEIAKTPLNLAQMGAGLWNLWVKLNKWRWLEVDDSGNKTQVKLIALSNDNYNHLVVNFADGQDTDVYGQFDIHIDDFQNFIFPYVSFRKAIFMAWVWFSNTIFQGYTWFMSATFKRAAEFSNAVFAGDVRFSEAVFEGVARFEDTIFKGDAWFSSVMFTKAVWFEDAVFKGSAWFADAEFEEDVWFSGAMFKGVAMFMGVTFKGDVGFPGSTFKGNATFMGVTFENGAQFSNVTFEEHVSFSGVTFDKTSLFNQAVFFGDVVLAGIWVRRNIDFNKAFFLRSIDLENAKIDGYADFDHTWFGKMVDASKPNLYTRNYLRKSWDQELKSVYDIVPVLDSESINIPNFKGTEFKLPPNLGYTNIPLPPKPLIPREKGDGEVQSAWRHLRRFLGIDQRYIRIKDANAASKFRRLQELAALGHNHHAEARFFRAELLARRGHEVVNPLRITAINCYELFSECGLSFLRPVGWWAFVFVLFALFAYLPFTRILVFDDPVNIGHLFNYTLSNALPFIGVFRGNDTVAVEVLYGGPAGIPFCNSFLAGTHNLISSILLFLALLAVRNYFKMR